MFCRTQKKKERFENDPKNAIPVEEATETEQKKQTWQRRFVVVAGFRGFLSFFLLALDSAGNVSEYSIKWPTRAAEANSTSARPCWRSRRSRRCAATSASSSRASATASAPSTATRTRNPSSSPNCSTNWSPSRPASSEPAFPRLRFSFFFPPLTPFFWFCPSSALD